MPRILVLYASIAVPPAPTPWRIAATLPTMGHSGAARAGMLNLTETAAFEWAPVRVNAVAPGFINTEMGKGMPENIVEAMMAKVPLKRMGEPVEIANAYLWLASDEASYVNGAVISVDGGYKV